MSAPDHLTKLKQVIYDQLGCDPVCITPQSRLIEDLGADSLDSVELIMAIEAEWGIDIPDREAELLITVRDVLDYIEANAEA
jgi:acyl carrier protein